MIKEYDLVEFVNGSKTTTHVYYLHDGIMVDGAIHKIVDVSFGIDKIENTIKTGYTKKLGAFNDYVTALREVEAIDDNAGNEFTSGFEFDGITFSTSQNAQSTLHGLPYWTEDMFPCKWVGKNNEDYILTYDKKDYFYKAFLQKQRDIKHNSGILKTQ